MAFSLLLLFIGMGFLVCLSFKKTSVSDPDPVGSVSFGRIRIRIRKRNQKLPWIRIRIRVRIRIHHHGCGSADPDPHQNDMGSETLKKTHYLTNINILKTYERIWIVNRNNK